MKRCTSSATATDRDHLRERSLPSRLGVAILGDMTAGAVAGSVILAGSWPSTDARVPPGLAALVTRAAGAAVSRPTL